MHPRRSRLKRIAVWTAAVVLLVMACMAGMPYGAPIVAKHAPGLLVAADFVFSPVAFATVFGVGIALAISGAWVRNRSVPFSLYAGLLSWGYVAYFAYTRKIEDHADQVRRDRIVWRCTIATAACSVVLAWYVLAWVGAAKTFNARGVSIQTQSHFRVVYSPLIGYCDSNWPGSKWLSNFYYVVNPVGNCFYTLAPSYHGIRTPPPEPPLSETADHPPLGP